MRLLGIRQPMTGYCRKPLTCLFPPQAQQVQLPSDTSRHSIGMLRCVDRTRTAEVVPFAIKAGTLNKVCLVQAWRMLRQQDVRAPQQPPLLTGPGSARRLLCVYHHPSYSHCSSSGIFLPC